MAWNLFPLYEWTRPICGMYIHYDPDSANDVFVNYYAADWWARTELVSVYWAGSWWHSEVDVRINTKFVDPTYRNAYPAPGHGDGQGITTHELGHFVGLNHSYYPTTMYGSPINPNGQVETVYMRDLHSDDIFGMNALYPPLHRLYHGGIHDHFYTASLGEANFADANLGYSYEGHAGYVWTSAERGTTSLYRLWHAGIGDHFYTTNPAERDFAIGLGYAYEGIAGYVWPTPYRAGNAAFYRLWHGGLGDHFYTRSWDEVLFATTLGYAYEGIQCYVHAR
ncbi:MAG: hypothetical protein QMD66_07545 [Actinomycetota bacterium]|nr:hypothetical protein [Actinomycetota bacterium]